MMELSVEAIGFLIAIAFLAGGVDALAGGGGLLTIPALTAAGIPPVSALATNKLQSTIGTSSAFLTFHRAGHVDLKAFAFPALGAFIGSVAGGTAVQFVDPKFLAAFVPVLLIAMGLYFLLAPPMSEVDRHARGRQAAQRGGGDCDIEVGVQVDGSPGQHHLQVSQGHAPELLQH